MNEQEVLAEIVEVQEEGGDSGEIQEGEVLGSLGSAINKFCSRIERPIAKMALHFKCNYCVRTFVGPSK